MTTPMETISKLAEVFAQARTRLAEAVTVLNDGIAALRKEHLPGERRAVQRAADADSALRALVEQHPECFARPKTRVLSGVKIGYAKGKGSITFDDADAVVARIKKHLPDQADVLIRKRETPVKEALSQLAATDLKKIGVTVSDAGDQVIVKPVDSDVDKLVDALLKGAADESEGE